MVARLRGQPIPIADIQIALEARFARGELSEREIATLRGEFDCLRVNSTTMDTIDKRGWLETAQRAVRRIDPSCRYELGIAWIHFGMALFAAGRHQQAIQRLEGWIEESGSVIDAGSIRGFLGLLFVHAQAGSLTQGAAIARTTIALAEHHGLRLSSAWAHRFLGDVLYEVNELDGAIEHFGAVARDHDYLHLSGVREALFGLALSYLATGRREEAARALRRSRELVIAAGVLHHLPAIEAHQAYLALLSGNFDEAALWASVHDPALSSESFHVLIHPAVIRATILCASADQPVVSSALASLDRVRREMVQWGYPGPMVRVDALRAVGLLRRGNRDAAIAAMRAACATARPNGHVRSFLDLQPMFARELENLAAAVMLPPAAQRALRRASDAEDHREKRVPDEEPIEVLTEREQEVLGYLYQRLSYREIGDELYISSHTVKRHITSIYSKLDVSGRSEAIRVARDRGWYT
jgi:LuxR family maltose regulon positive regulatory protein